AVFAGWCLAFAGRFPTMSDSIAAIALGAVLILAGQVLNVMVFYRLGRIAVFFGHWLGPEGGWGQAFPFSMLAHPQYVGTVLTIWGFFLAARFPHDDWFLLPVLETIYYAAGAFLEGRGEAKPARQAPGTEPVMRTQP